MKIVNADRILMRGSSPSNLVMKDIVKDIVYMTALAVVDAQKNDKGLTEAKVDSAAPVLR